MNYGGNMPDWHQYNAAQTNEIASSTQNVNSGHLAFIPGVNHSTLNAHSLGSESLNKHQNDANFNSRNYQSYNNVSNGPNIPNNSPLASMVQMQNCIGHYGSTNTRNPMLDNINASVDPRNATVGVINDELGYRTNQVPFNGPIGHLSGPSCNLNASSGPIPGPGPGPGTGFGSQTNSGPGSNSGNNSGTVPGPNSMYGPGPRHGPMSGPGSVSGSGNLGPRNTNINSVSSGKSGTSSFMPCKGVCCNSNPNINYQQWEKFGLYPNSAPFRDNVHLSGCQMENRHFGNNYNFRKDNLEGKEVMGPVLPNAPAIDHRRNYSDYKYHKDHLAHRNYPASSGMFHNYPVQNYNYSTEHQKYTYPVKEHPKANNMNMSNSGMLKHQEQNFINQQKFNNKQFQYQNGNILPKGVPTLNVNTNMATSPQNPYFNAQFPRNITTEMNHECQETTDSTTVVNRIPNTFMHSTPPQHQVYQHKIAMQKYAMESHLRELSNIPGYQSHPKYKECVLRYREILKLQQSAGYQNPVQQNPRVATPVNPSVPPINLHFDQNGMLINSSYIADGFSKVQHAPSVESSESIEKQSKDQAIAIANEKRQQLQESEQLIIPPQSERIPSSCVETFPKQNQFPVRKDFNQNQLKVQTSENHNFDTLNTVKNNETAMLQQKASKEFANKPELDVRQFLANWDETDDEDGATSNMQDTALNETAPVVVVSYENVDVPPKTPQGTEVSKRTSYCSNETDLDKGKEGETNVIATQDCLTISYSPPGNTEIAKTSKRTIREGVVKPGSIIHCISNGPDEIPTIHIVDNLEISNILGTCSEQVIQTLEKQKTISFFKETSNNETVPMTLEDAEQQDKNETDVLSTNYDGSLNDVTKNTNMEGSDPVRTNAVSINSQELRAKNNLDVTNNMDLRKQNSFASEESHNPDDISLPDLPTSECTPISTTLNTPIHSDTEESSQNMEDLSISTNPIEVMQNSPVISFTQLNSEEKSKNGSLGTLELEFQKQSGYKTNDQEVTLGNFNFASDSKVKSAESAKGKQVKCLGTNTVRKKSFLIDGKEIDTRISDTCDALTSMEYELDVEQEPAEREKISERASPGCMKHRSTRKSTDSIKSVIQSDSVDNIVHNVPSVDINANLSPTESDDETQTSRRRRANISSASRGTNRSEVDQNTRKRAKERMDLDDRGANKYTERSSTRRRDTADHLRQSKGSDARRFDEASSSQSEEHTVCHMTSQYKNYSVAVIKDKVTLSDSRSGRGLDRTSGGKSPDARTNTKELSDGMEIKKRVSGRPHESVPHQSSRKSELLQKDLKPVDGVVRYTAEEIRMLKEYRRRKAQDKSKHTFKSSEESQKNDESSSRSRSGKLECPQSRQSNELRHGASSEQNVLSVVNLSAKKLDTREEMTAHACSKSFCKNADFGIQVTNVNLKIKDNDMGKELILGEKGPEQIKDSLEGIQIQINVSCTDQNSKGQEQNKRMYDERGLYETEESPALNCQCRLHAKEQETVDASRTTDKADRIGDKPVDTVQVISTVADKNANPLKKRRRSSMGINEDACVLTSTHNDACSKEALKTDSEGTVYPVDDKVKRAICNTAIVDANNKIKTKSKREDGDREDSRNLEMAKVQKAPSTSHVDTSTEAFKRHEEKESVHQPKNTKKLPDSGVEVNARSLSSLNTLDFNFDYKKYSNVGELDDDYPGKWKKPKIDQIFEDCDVFQSSSGYVNPIFSSMDKLEDLHTVPVYTTKDGKISYSPNRKFTYHDLMMEARKRDACVPAKKSHYADTWNSYYSSKFRKLYKRRRHHPFSEKKKYEFKSTKYLYDRKRNYSDEFYGKSNTRYKDSVHSIKNNNAVWLDQYKVDRMYSSSDSDEEIKRRIDEASGCKKSHETKLVSPNSPRNHVTVDELDVDYGNKEDGTSDVCLSKDKDTCSKESQAVQLESLDAGTGNETCQDNDNNVNDNLAVMQSDVTLTATINQGNEDAKSNLNECSALEESCEFAPEKIEVNESKHLSDECTEPSVRESKDSIVPGNEEDTVNTVDGSSALELLNEVPSSTNQNEQIASSNVEGDKNSEMCLLETTQLDKQEEENDGSKALDDQPSTVDNAESIRQVELCEDLQTHQAESSQFEINVANCSSATETSESRANSSNINLQVSEESLEPEKYTDALDEIVEESSENIDDKVNEEMSIITEENILGCAEENIELTEEIVILSKEHEPEECISEEMEKNVESLYENDSDSPKEALNEISEEQENSESQIDVTIDQQNNLDFGVSETVENQKDIVIASVQMGQNEDEPILIDFSKDTIYNENDNAIESLDASNAEEMEIALSSIKDTSMEEQEMIDHLHDHCDDMQSMSEHNSNSSSVEKEMPVLNEYCTVNDSPVGHPDDIDRTENYDDTEKEDHLSFDPFDNCVHSPESNMDVKAIPKLIIKKTDALNPKSDSLSNSVEIDNCPDIYDAKLLPETRPKIPKMIIVKSRSRSVTPTVELLEKAKSERTPQHSLEDNDVNVNVDNSDSEQYTLKYNNYKNKVPKVKIKLEDISSKDLKLYLKRKTSKSIPKMKIKKLKNQDVKAHISVSKVETQDTSETDATDSENENARQSSMVSDTEMEKIPKLRLKRHDEDKSLEETREKDCNVSKVIPKKSRKTKEEDTRHSVKQDNITTNDNELRKKFPQYIIEKVPKVIIKRTQIGAEFKCEISKSKKSSVAETSKWQPKVKLQRLELLDNIVKDLKQSKITLKNILNTPTRVTENSNSVTNNNNLNQNKVKLSRSNSVSSLSPVKCKQRRLSDSGYLKTYTKSVSEFSGNSRNLNDRVAGSTSVISESPKKKNRKSLSSQNKSVNPDLNNENETDETIASRSTVKDSFGNFLINEYNDLMITKSEYNSCFMSEESTLSAENKFLESDITQLSGYDNNDNSIIKVDTSDESQTTIEILPASPDSCDGETEKSCEFETTDKLRMDDAIPTQLELELELIDNKMRHSGVFMLDSNDRASPSKSKYSNEKSGNAYFSGFQRSSEDSFDQDKYMSEQNGQSSGNTSNDYLHSTDLLVKEVLAAKEALKKCLSRAENKDADSKTSRPKTVAEKKQGLSFNFKGFDESYESECAECNNGDDNAKVHRKSKNLEKKEHKSPRRADVEGVEERYLKQNLSVGKEIISKDSQNETIYSGECPTASTCGHTDVPESTTISLKASKKSDKNSTNNISLIETDITELTDKLKDEDDAKEFHGEKSKKETNSCTQRQKEESSNDAKAKENNMPLLIPEFALNFDSSSDRDSSRSPPVITNQEEVDNAAVGEKSIENKVIAPIEKIEESKDSYKDCEMTIADIITQLAYHEKATIKHKRYCNLCERWFPTTSRHRRHLAGYQHRYMELAQRKSIHALFILFTGKPCPRLLPATVIRNDCSIGELTPLQIAVQDIAKCVEYTQQDFKTKD